jgi:hypothetical protein
VGVLKWVVSFVQLQLVCNLPIHVCHGVLDSVRFIIMHLLLLLLLVQNCCTHVSDDGYGGEMGS